MNTFMSNILVTGLATNPDGFWGAIQTVITSWANSFIDKLLVPVGLLVCAGFFVWLLISVVGQYQEGHGDQIKGKIMFMVLIIVIAALLLTKNTWWGFVFAG